MSFVAENDYVILMDCPGPLVTNAHGWAPDHWLRLDDLKRLKDAGCQTVWETVWWDEIEKERGERDWAHVDAVVERVVTGAGLRVLLNTYHHPPPAGILPEEWYQRYDDGAAGSHLSLWNEEAQTYEHEFIRELRARYESDQVKCINSLQADGETLLHLRPCFHDTAAVKSHGPRPMNLKTEYTRNWLRDSLVKTLLDQHDAFGGTEMWLGMHLVIRNMPCGTPFIPDVYQAFRAQRPEVELWVIQYTYFPHGPLYRKAMRDRQAKYNLNVVGGAEYCAGLPRNTPLAIEDGIRLLVGPTHPFTEKKRVDDQMLEVIASSIRHMKEERP